MERSLRARSRSRSLALAVVLGTSLAGGAAPAAFAGKKPVCEGGAWVADGRSMLAVGAERAFGEAILVDLAAGTVRVTGCDAVPARIRGKRNQNVKAEFPVGSCPGRDAVAKLRLRLKEDCAVAKGKLKVKTSPREKVKILARVVGELEPVLEEASAVEGAIGPAGGQLETTDSAGRHYTLEIPAGAIAEERLLTLTPVTGIGGLAIDGLVAAADFAPAGLWLVPPATLTIEFPEDIAPEPGVAFGYGATAADLELHLIDADARTMTLPVLHFSGAGGGTGPPAPSQGFAADVAAAQLLGDQQLETAACATWFDAQIEPALRNATTTQSLTSAMGLYLGWAAYCASATDPGREALAESLLRSALLAGVQRANATCSFESANLSFTWQSFAESFGVDTGDLAYDAVAEATCLSVVYVDTQYPGTPQVGVAHLLRVTAGVSLGGGAPVFSQPLIVHAVASGASPAEDANYTDGSGLAQLGGFAVDGSGDASFTIESCISSSPYPALAFVCQTALVVRGLEVSPGAATIDVDQTQAFEAIRFGASYTNVTWSATGGSISSAGLYRAPSTAGTFTVTATDATNPGSSASATVTVQPGSGSGTGCVDAIAAGLDYANLRRVRVLRIATQEERDEDNQSTGSVSYSISQGGCTASGSSLGFGSVEARLHSGSDGCNGTHLYALMLSSDFVKVTPADPTQRPSLLRGRLEASISGVMNPAVGFDAMRVFTKPPFDAASGSSFSGGGIVDVEFPFYPDAPWATPAVKVEAHSRGFAGAESEVTAKLRWLGITEVLDQDGDPIASYQICSNSGVDYRNAVP
jgi:hypothetical protein